MCGQHANYQAPSFLSDLTLRTKTVYSHDRKNVLVFQNHQFSPKSIVPECIVLCATGTKGLSQPEVMSLAYKTAAIADLLGYSVFSKASWVLFCRSCCPLKYSSPITKAVTPCFSLRFLKVKRVTQRESAGSLRRTELDGATGRGFLLRTGFPPKGEMTADDDLLSTCSLIKEVCSLQC